MDIVTVINMYHGRNRRHHHTAIGFRAYDIARRDEDCQLAVAGSGCGAAGVNTPI